MPNNISYENDLELLCDVTEKDKIFRIFKKLKYIHSQDSLENNTYLYNALPHDHFRKVESDIHVDIVYNLSYKSPNKGEWVSVHKELQESIWDNKIKVNRFWLYQPSELDEFIHIICHSIFDKQEFKTKHIDRINYLYPIINKKDACMKLSLVFFKFAPYLIEKIQDRKYKEIFKSFLQFTKY